MNVDRGQIVYPTPERCTDRRGPLVIHAPCLASDAGWPQWRGPDGQGHAPDAHGLPVAWSETTNVAWKTPLPGRGWSSPVIDDGTIWLTTASATPLDEAEKPRRIAEAKKSGNASPLEASGPVSFCALAVDRATGRLVRDIELFVVDDPQPIHALNSFASPSPVLGNGRLYCHFGDCGTACVDTASGTVAWRTERSGRMHDNVQFKKTCGAPLVVTLGGRELLVSPAADWLYGYDPRTGVELWKAGYGVFGFSIVPRPTGCSS